MKDSYKMFLWFLGIALFIGVLLIRHHTHAYSKPDPVIVSKALDKLDITPAIQRPTKDIGLDCYPKEALQVVAIDASKHTVDFIVNKMITDKFVIVNKDGWSYRFKFVKKYKQPKEKK